jgi:hypothetical protein
LGGAGGSAPRAARGGEDGVFESGGVILLVV